MATKPKTENKSDNKKKSRQGVLYISYLPQDSEYKAITEAIISMGKTLNLTVVAEGVETKEQEDCLGKHICDEMQGFYFSKPIAPD